MTQEITDEPQSKRILLLGTGENRLPDYARIYAALRATGRVETETFNQREIRQIGKVLKALPLQNYDAVIADIPFKHLRRAALELRQAPGLLIYEQDACQNFLRGSKWYGEFDYFYRLLPHAQLALTGHQVSEKFRQLGLNAHFVAKGFDESQLSYTATARDISAGFIGRVRSNVYAERARYLESLADSHDVALMRTETTEEYNELLNRIGIFVSADVGLGEYMAKNFEAMACGCALLACRQGAGEEEALGLIDMENVALYSSLEEAGEKLTLLQHDSALRNKIADAGRQLAWDRYTFSALADRLYKLAVTTDGMTAPPLTWIEQLKVRLRKG
ncbi:MAG: hypothetical protein CMN84_01050 [Spongiibacteraceae bacterium]|jgi:hypothetical protein|nr:hypothetical protein [Spongiibacteraceae bacterium]